VSLSSIVGSLKSRLLLRSTLVSGLLVFTWGTGALAAETPAPSAKPAPTQASLEEAVAKLRKVGKSTTATQLLAAVDKAKAERQKLGRGRVVVGHLSLQGGTGRLDPLTSQVSLVSDGWFVTLAEDLRRPIALRLHGYEAVDIPLTGLPDLEVLHVGDIPLSPVSPMKIGVVHGRVVAADPKARIQVYAFIVPGEPNSLTGKVSGDRPAARLEVKREKDGSFQLGGLSPPPARYELWFKAPGHAPQSRVFNSLPGGRKNLGEIRLEKPTRLRVRYIVSSTPPPFQNATVRQAVVQLGQSFKADPAMQGVTFSYEQRPHGERLRFPQQPARLAALGKGKPEDYSSVNPSTLKLAAVFEAGFEPGQLYLLEHHAAGQWVLFVLEPDTGDAK